MSFIGIGSIIPHIVNLPGQTGEGISAAFSYSKSSFRQDESDPTPTITGTQGGTFTSTPNGLSINPSTGTIDLENSSLNSYTITYTVQGVSAQQSLSVISPITIDNNFSMEFDGVASYFDLATDNSLDIFGSNFSASLWFKTNDTATASGLIQIGSFTNRVFAITKGNAADKIGFVYGINSWYYNIGSGLNDGNWHHVVLVRDTGTYTIYIDKVPYTSFTGPGTYNTGGYNSIGRGLTTPQYFNGYLDEIALFNNAISANTVNAIYDTTANNPGKVYDLSQVTEGAPVAWYRMGD